jgi:hypothetical protein
MDKPSAPWPLAIEFQLPEVSFVTPQILMRKATATRKRIVEPIEDEDKLEEHEQNKNSASVAD